MAITQGKVHSTEASQAAVVAEGKSLEFTIDLCIESERDEIVVLSGHESEEL